MSKRARNKRRGADPEIQWQLAAYETSAGKRPALEFLSGADVPDEVRTELLATLVAVSERDPRTFRSFGERWTFMHKPEKKGDVDMRGIAEARDKHRKLLYRVFCVVDVDAVEHGLSAPAIVMLGGGCKPVGEKLPQPVYRRIDGYRNDYWENHRVAKSNVLPGWWPKVGDR